MAAVRLVFNMRAFRDLRCLPSVQDDMFERAQRIASASGPGYAAVRTFNPRNRARAAALTRSYAARRDNARNHTLIANLNAGR